MKRLYVILALASVLGGTGTAYAQENNQQRERRTPVARTGSQEAQKKENGLPELTVRAQDMNDRMTQEIGNARWIRVIYREVDMNKEENAPLYYPVRPMNGNMNLFSTIFQLLSEGKLTVYEYLDGYEAFEDDHIIDFKTILDKYQIYYEEVPGRGGEEPSYIINESDVPSAEVHSYLVKEAWYFDQNNSVFDVKTLAICPIMTVVGDLGEQRTPLFWLPYESLRPYITNSLIMTSNLNNAKTFTIDDYFRRRMFDGEIIKTENLMNKTLREYYPQPDSLKLAQERIEHQLTSFQESLYWHPDTTQVADTKEARKAAKARVKETKATQEKETKVKEAKAPKAESTAPIRSVRRRR